MLTIMLVASSAALAATTVYTWVDASGETHYSDQPHAGARKMEVAGVATFSLPPAAQNASDTAPPPRARPQAQCSIASPADQQMFMNAWSVTGQVEVPPHLNGGDHVVLLLDGKILTGVAGLSGAFTLDHVDRGAHTLAAQVVSADGQVVCQAPPVTFYVHQPSKQAPNPANRPRF
ncbi:MAG: DUF4124 domain-containing protein [Steroidobacteraceae bacterium]